MATTFNAFTALVGTGEQVQGKKKAKKKPTQPKQVASEVGSPTTADVPTAVHTKAVDASTAVVNVSEACAIVEKAARSMKSGQDRLRLWKDWIRQVGDKSGKAIRYTGGTGLEFDFKEMLLKSRALEITVEGCLTSPLPPQNEINLQHLLAAVLPRGERQASVVAHVVVRLSDLLASEAIDTVGAAQRVVSTLIANLKQGLGASDDLVNPFDAWLSRLNGIDTDTQRQQAWLQKLAQTSGNLVTKEQLSYAKHLLQLHQEKVDMLQPHNLPAAKPVSHSAEPSLRCLEELRQVISGHMQGAVAFEASSQGAGEATKPQKAATLAALQREEATLAQQAAELAQQIKGLEAQLSALRAHAVEVEERRAQVKQRATMANSTKAQVANAEVRLPVSHYQEELSVVEALVELVDPNQARSGGVDQVNQMRAAHLNSNVEYVLAVQQYLHMNLALLGDLPQKVAFCKQRIDKADKMLLLGISPKAGKDGKDPREEAERLLQEHARTADDTLNASLEALRQLHSRFDYLTRATPDQASVVMSHVRGAEDLVARIRAQYDVLVAHLRGQAPPPAVHAAAPHQAVPVAAVAPALSVVAPPLVAQAAKPAANAAATVGVTASRAAPEPVPAAKPKANGSALPASPAPAPTPGRQWTKVEQPPPASNGADAGAPTPAEAFNADAGDGFQQVGKRNRKRA